MAEPSAEHTDSPIAADSPDQRAIRDPETEPRALGRVYMPDPRDAAFPLSAALPRSAMRESAWKTTQWMLGRAKGKALQYRDQGQTSECVRYGCAHLLLLAPIVRADAFDRTADLYRWAQANDEWPGGEPDYYGTSVRAGLQYLRKVAGLITEFRWAQTIEDVIAWLTRPKHLGGGPLVVGTDWWTGMDNLQRRPSASNWWAPTGQYRGGHCWNLTGYVAATAGDADDYFLTGNSHDGNHRGKIRRAALEYLLFQANGEAAAITEVAA